MKNKYSILCIIICILSTNLIAQNTTEIQCKLIQFPKVFKQNNAGTIKIKITNFGKDFNDEIIANLAIDGELISTKMILFNLHHQESQEITFNYLFNISISEHQLKVWFTDKLNKQIHPSFNSIESDFFVARTTVPQLPLIEEFTSSTCGPCALFNSSFDPFLASINANEDGGQVAAVKYQMNWPPPGDDPSFNTDGNGRKGTYAVSGIPISFLNGVATSTFDQSVIDAASGASAFEMAPYFYLSGDTVKATGTVIPYTNTTSLLRVHLALTEDFYTYTGGTTSQTSFHYVMRKMLPNYVGTVISNIHEDTVYTIHKNFKVTYDNVLPNSNNIWGTSAGFTLVSWLQNPSTKEVYQAAIATSPSAMTIPEHLNNVSIEVFPNPVNEYFTINLLLNKKARVTYTLTDIAGKLVQQAIVQDLPEGKHVLQTSTQDLKPGIYICKVHTNETSFSERIVVIK